MFSTVPYSSFLLLFSFLNVHIRIVFFCAWPSAGELSVCSLRREQDVYIMSAASKGRWPVNGLCRAFSRDNVGDRDNYRVDVKFLDPMKIEGPGPDFFGIIFNTADYNNHDFVFYKWV